MSDGRGTHSILPPERAKLAHILKFPCDVGIEDLQMFD